MGFEKKFIFRVLFLEKGMAAVYCNATKLRTYNINLNPQWGYEYESCTLDENLKQFRIVIMYSKDFKGYPCATQAFGGQTIFISDDEICIESAIIKTPTSIEAVVRYVPRSNSAPEHVETNLFALRR